MNDHARVMKLELDHATLEAFSLWKVFGEFTGKFTINIEFKIVIIGDDVH